MLQNNLEATLSELSEVSSKRQRAEAIAQAISKQAARISTEYDEIQVRETNTNVESIGQYEVIGLKPAVRNTGFGGLRFGGETVPAVAEFVHPQEHLATIIYDENADRVEVYDSANKIGRQAVESVLEKIPSDLTYTWSNVPSPDPREEARELMSYARAMGLPEPEAREIIEDLGYNAADAA